MSPHAVQWDLQLAQWKGWWVDSSLHSVLQCQSYEPVHSPRWPPGSCCCQQMSTRCVSVTSCGFLKKETHFRNLDGKMCRDAKFVHLHDDAVQYQIASKTAVIHPPGDFLFPHPSSHCFLPGNPPLQFTPGNTGQHFFLPIKNKCFSFWYTMMHYDGILPLGDLKL